MQYRKAEVSELKPSSGEPARALTRREVGRLALAVLAGAPVLAACQKSGPICTDLSTLTPAERDLRLVTLGYQDKSPDPQKVCAGCVQYGEPDPNDTVQSAVTAGCGRCQILRGPVSPRGRCKRWSERAR